MKKFYLLAAVLVTLSLGSYADIAYDDAANSTYNFDVAYQGLNGGYGFNAWSLSGSGGSYGHYLNLSNRGTSGFRLYSGSGSYGVAERGFENPLGVGHTFSAKLGHFGGNNGQVGISLSSGGSDVFNLNLQAGSDYWSAWFGGEGSSSVLDLNDPVYGMADYFTTDNNIASFSFTYNGGNSFGFSLKDELGNGFEVTDWIASADISNIDGVVFYSSGQGGGTNFYTDQLSIIPEPATVGLLGLFGSSLAWFRKRFSS